MHLGKSTVTDLIEELEGCDPHVEARLAHQPTWPFEYAVDPGNAAVEVDLDDTIGRLH